MIHSIRPAIQDNLLTDECKLNGRQRSTKSKPLKEKPSKCQSAGHTRQILRAFLISSFARYAPCPRFATILTASLTWLKQIAD